MENINIEVGCIYDAIIFLSYYADEIINRNNFNDFTKSDPYYLEIKQKLEENNIDIPEYLLPFICRQNTFHSFLQSVLFDGMPYRRRSYKQLIQIISNAAYFNKAYIEFYFPNIDMATRKKLLSRDSPEIISIIKEKCADSNLEAYLLNTFFCFPAMAKTLLSIVEHLYSVLWEMHQSNIQELKISKLLRDDLVSQKLHFIVGIKEEYTLVFTLSLLDDEVISFHDDEPDFILLGINFMKLLDVKYKYCHVTPLLFAKAVGNLVKYDIFKALTKNSAMNISDMYSALHYGRGELQYNLKEMQKDGIITVNRIIGRQYFYELDKSFIRIIIEQLYSVVQ